MVRLICFLLIICSASHAQQVDWISFEKLPEKMRTQPRPVLVFIHTSWCKYCAMQNENTFADSLVIRKIDQMLYAISLDAEHTEEVIFLKRKYKFKSSGSGTGYHELAEFLGKKNGVLIFPTTVILTKSLQPLGQFPGFLNVKDLLHVLDDSR